MGTPTLQGELDALNKTVRAATSNPFLPAPARDAIVQACFVIDLLAAEVMKPAPADRAAAALDRLAAAIEADVDLKRAMSDKANHLFELVYPRLASEFATLAS